jgi:hypothetical protein
MIVVLLMACVVGLIAVAVFVGSAIVDSFGLVGALLLIALIAWMWS